MTAQEWLSFADKLKITEHSHVLEVGSGSGGPAMYLAMKRGCRINGVDINPHGVQNGLKLAQAAGLADRVEFPTIDAAETLSLGPATFSTILSNDAMCHIKHRVEVLRDWHRILRPSGLALFTDAMVITGLISHEELATRSSIGFYLFVPPGENERLLREAGFEVLEVEDLTANTASIS